MAALHSVDNSKEDRMVTMFKIQVISLKGCELGEKTKYIDGRHRELAMHVFNHLTSPSDAPVWHQL